MSVTFRCKASGNFVTFEHQVDIKTTRENAAYEEVKEEPKKEEKIVVKKPAKE